MNRLPSPNFTSKKIITRGRVATGIVLALMLALLWQLASLQIFFPDLYRDKAIEQYTHTITLTANRGTIYDRNMVKLAQSSTVYTIFISPADIKDGEEAEKIADFLSSKFDKTKEEILKLTTHKSRKYEIIAKEVEDALEQEVREFIDANEFYREVNIEESSKRYYPYGTVASQIIGSVGSDNMGLNGIELTYNALLSGVNGRAVKGQDAKGRELPFKYESFIAATNGTDIVLTIDYTIQAILEKYLEEAFYLNNAKENARGIIMDVKTGEILAMACYPTYDLNNASTLNAYYQAKYDAFEGTEKEKDDYYWTLVYDMWKNKSVTELYEPGSTFKIFTTSVALEEKTSSLSDTFNCTGIYQMGGTTYHCHSNPHGHQTFSQALVNSCNPALIAIGQNIGIPAFMKYFDSFGYTGKINSDILGEQNPYFYNTMTNYDLASSSFGQTFSISMLQQIRAVSSIANKGVLVTPHLVKSYVNNDSDLVRTLEYDSFKQVVSAETAKAICDILVNPTQSTSLTGYNLITKTGTSQKLNRKIADTNEYEVISSCVSFAPAEDPRIAMLVCVDEPQNGSRQNFGSQVAFPIIAKTYSEILPTLGYNPDYVETVKQFRVTDYRGADIEETKYTLEQNGIKAEIKGNGSIVVDQIPKMGSMISEGGRVVLYTDSSEPAKVNVPDFKSLKPNEIFNLLASKKLNVLFEGVYNRDFSCFAVGQNIESGTVVDEGTVVTVRFAYTDHID